MLPLIPLLTAFLVTLFLLRKWIPAAERFGLVGKDMNKYGDVKVAESGGITVVLGISFGLFVYLFLKLLFWGTETHILETFALLVTVVYSGLLGFVDDILGWKKGLKQWEKPLLTVPVALPLIISLMVSGKTHMQLLGDLGPLYYLIALFGLVGSSNAFNILAGYNGLEAGMGVIILGFQGIYAYTHGQLWIALLALTGISALLAFLKYNWYPARVFPGDSLTYAIGAYIGALAILGSMELFSLSLMPLYFLDLALYLKGRFLDKKKKIEAFGKPRKDGTLALPYEKLYDTTHIAIKLLGKKATERNVVLLVLGTEIILGSLLLLVFP